MEGRPPKRRRLSGELPYPLTRSQELMDIESCSDILLADFCNGITTHEFPESSPPDAVLDLGCGRGTWAIKAAQTWPRCRVTGFDVGPVQPRLDRLPGLEGLARRVEWINGNFLERLPFDDNTFDFVRMCGVGLAIPEDEWLAVLEEVRRVMKPGAVLECIEDDPVFPAPSSLLVKQSDRLESPPQESATPSSPVSARELRKSRSTVFRDHPNSQTDTVSGDRPTLASRLSSLLASKKSIPDFVDSPPAPAPLDVPGNRDAKPLEHPQDHSRLKASWNAMLARRFLPATSLSTLLFYLTTSSFNDARLLHHITVPLPTNSGVPLNIHPIRSQDSLRPPKPPRLQAHSLRIDTLLDFGPSSLSPISPRERRNSSEPSSSGLQSPSRPTNPYRCAMHLAKTVAVIRSCKEAIWKEWEELYGHDTTFILERMSPGDEAIGRMQPRHLVRHTFEKAWRNWEFDMINRQNMSAALNHSLGWTPAFEGKPENGSYMEWREEMIATGKLQGYEVAPHTPTDLCRSLRVYIASKA